ncbi:MAG: hypothetical protein QY326_05930 [Bdellovibrionota bacterium]|nr:MAG: hypothetical protein QY326_05930 [Bdellovibrionota bacterium]
MKRATQKGARSTPVFSVDLFEDGLVFGQHRLESAQLWTGLPLALGSEGTVAPLHSRYSIRPDNNVSQLEGHLQRLSRLGILSSSVIFFGTVHDPMYPFEGRFDNALKLLQVFQRYQPGVLVLQTRSPLLVIAMPALKALADRLVVTIGIETPDDSMARRYTPAIPAAEDRFKMARTLKRFHIPVHVQVNPVLPYGDWKRDAAPFAASLIECSDAVFVAPLCNGSSSIERRVRRSPIGQRLALDRKFHWLRPDAAEPLQQALAILRPESATPARAIIERQLKLFVA